MNGDRRSRSVLVHRSVILLQGLYAVTDLAERGDAEGRGLAPLMVVMIGVLV